MQQGPTEKISSSNRCSMKIKLSITVLFAAILLLQSCQQQVYDLQHIELIEGAVKIALPKSWDASRPLLLFGPDCSCCSGSDYSRLIGSGPDTCLIVSSIVYPCRDNTFRPLSPEALRVAALKDPRAVVVDTFSDKKRGMTALGQFSVRYGKEIYSKTVQVAGKHRTVQFSLSGKRSGQTKDLFQHIQQSIQVDSAYLN